MSILSWLKRRRLDDEDFQEEIRAHLAIARRRTDGRRRRSPRSAQLASLKEFGNVTLTTEAARRVWTPWWLDALHDQMSDVRYAIRALAKNPVFSLTVVGVLTLGIGLNAAVFTMLKGIALSPIAGVERIGPRSPSSSAKRARGRQLRAVVSRLPVPPRSRPRVLGRCSARRSPRVGLGRGRSARPVWGELVTGNYFQVLGVRAERGRTLLPSDEIAPGRHPVVVLSDGLWRRDFGADPDIVGKTIEINNYPLTVVGVADPTFHGTTVVYDVEVFVPVMMAPAARLQVRQPADHAVGHPRRLAAPRCSIRRATCGPARRSRTPPPRPTRSGPRSRAIGRSPMPRSG